MSDLTSPRVLLAAAFGDADPRVVDYLLTGTDVGFPGSLSEHARASLTALPPEGRSPFYLAMDRLDRADDLVLVRLGRLLAALNLRGYPAPEGVPLSIWALLADATATTFGDAGHHPAFTTLSIDRLRALLALEGVVPEGLDGMLVDLLIGSSRSTLEYGPRGLQTIPGTAQFATEHARAVIARTVHFSGAAHLELARLASSHPPLAVAVAPVLVGRALAGSADERNAALAAIGAIPPEVQVATFTGILDGASAKDRGRLIPAIERIPDIPAAIALLEGEKARGVTSAARADLDRAIRRLRIYAQLAPAEPVPPLVPLEEHELGPEAVESIRVALTAHRDRLRERLPALRAERDEFVRQYDQPAGNSVEWAEERLRDAEDALAALPDVVAYLSGTGRHPGRKALDAVSNQHVRPRLAGFTPVNWIRLGARPGAHRVLRGGVAGEGVADARAIADVLIRTGCTPQEAVDTVVQASLVDGWSTPGLRPDQLTWFMREHPATFDNVLGLTVGPVPVPYYDNRSDVLRILAASSSLPSRYAALVAGIATGTGKTNRPAAQAVLARHGLAQAIAGDTLLSPSADQRAVAIQWAQDIGGRWAVDILAGHLHSETEPSLRARAIASLEALGEDIAAHLRPEVLAAEAQVGLVRRLPASIAWVPLDELPACIYRDGTRVPGDVVRWWVVLAATLKDPLGAGLLPRYLRTLEPASAQTLSRWILMVWIARDTAPLDEATVLRRAMDSVARYEQRTHRAMLLFPELQASVDDWFGLLDAERTAIAGAATSAIGDKGLLALAGAVPGPELAETVRQYMRREHLKRAQIEALMNVLSTSDDPEPLQLLVATARRYRTAGVQQAAAALVEQAAARRGWTPDELADRMIPAAGLDADRSLRLDYGPRAFVARLDLDLTLRLETEDGDALNALPAPRVSDTSAGAAKAALATSRKELKALVAVQRRRLYDAMCLRRQWPVAQWRELLLEHPVMGLLISAVVWQADGVSVRPDPDGTVRDAAGSPVALRDDAVITVAHTTTLTADEIARWTSRPSPVGAGFDQFRAPPVDGGTETRRNDREGREGETFRLRGRARTLEWDRGPTGDDVRFDEYVKNFAGARLQGAVSFSGSQLPETDQPIEFGVLTIRRLDAEGRVLSDLTFDEVPDALRAELVADYLALGE